MDVQSLFIQDIEHIRTGNKIEIAFIQELTFIETMDLSGPRLIIEVNDPYSWLRDIVGLTTGDQLRVSMSDMYVRDGMNEVMDFTVLSHPVDDDTVVVNAMATRVCELKSRVATGTVFQKQSPGAILNKMLSGMGIDIGKFPAIEDYHVLAGEYPSYMLRQMAREHGAHVFISRETVCFKRLSDLMGKKTPDLTYHSEDMTQENQIIYFNIPSAQHVLEDKLLRRYSGWNMTKGWITVGDKSVPPVRSSSQSSLTMKNDAIAPKPVLDYVCTGNGALRAGSCIDIVWNTNTLEAPIDESLPKRVIASVVAHYYSANKYYCRVKGVVPLEKMAIIDTFSPSSDVPNIGLYQDEADVDKPTVISDDYIIDDDEILNDNTIMGSSDLLISGDHVISDDDVLEDDMVME